MTTLLYLWHVCQCLIVGLLLGFIEYLLRFVLSIKHYKSLLHELFPHFLCLRHQASLDDITHVAKSLEVWGVASVGSNGDQWINCQTPNYFYNRIILVLLYQNDVKVKNSKWVSTLVWFTYTCTCTSTYIFVEHHWVLCGHRLGSGTTWPSQWFAF